ncbi:DM13 domain-containing protein [Amycolatopsis vastitatis]|uniref:Electron transporter n=1 Tax=Amycolatopsis vastitatis TaxID=1905142 RepID=A0A229SZD3_9PSEU|nr:DM13 domain-containing protein [Amycolatopsis vastitatis]OXM64232.1 electron transporter [Amycolatopsis vastitatis]
MNRVRRLLTRPWISGILVTGLVAVAAGLFWFQPWQLVVNETVQEDLPAAAPAPAPVSTQPSQPSSSSPSAPAAPTELATGTLISHEHRTTGTVRILRTTGGSLVLRLENLDTSSGPDVHVWLTDAPVKPGKDGWAVFDDGRHLDAGSLKGNKGNQNYPLPAGTDLTAYTSVSIWCERFDVSFGAAALTQYPAPVASP